MRNVNMWVGLALLALSMSAQAEMRVVSEVRAAPANYHQTYAAIINTVVSIDQYTLKTTDGKVIKVKADPNEPTGLATIDLQGLTGVKRGLEINLTKAELPGNVQIVDIVEIEARVTTARQPFVNFNNGTPQCKMAVPKRLIFYTKTAPAQMVKDQCVEGPNNPCVYLVKIEEFRPLDDVQLEIVTQGQQEVEACNAFQSIFNGECGPCVNGSRTRGKIKYRQSPLKCELVNERHAIQNIVRKIDEF